MHGEQPAIMSRCRALLQLGVFAENLGIVALLERDLVDGGLDVLGHGAQRAPGGFSVTSMRRDPASRVI